MDTRAIGVLDSGVGGLTVVKELQQLLPQEHIIYFGDSANCPYGNRSRQEIATLTAQSIEFLQEQNIKALVLACNTISTLAPQLRTNVPIIDIIRPTVAALHTLPVQELGLVGTVFTIKSGVYDRYVDKEYPGMQLYTAASATLAESIENHSTNMPLLAKQVEELLLPFRSHAAISHIILGCTHFPIIQPLFEATMPEIEFLNPAYLQAQAVKELLKQSHLQNNSAQAAQTLIYTTGKKEEYYNLTNNILNFSHCVVEK